MQTLRSLRFLLVALALTACVGGDDGGDDTDYTPDLVPDPADEGCSPLFAQGIMPAYHVTISDAEWAAMNDEFENRVAREAAGMPRSPYHPIQLRYEDGVREPLDVPNVLMRLKGASSWLQTLEYDANPKMQFVIAFNEVNPDQRFLGVRKVELDMPRTDRTFMKHRLALHYMRTAGTYAQCANNARIYINGEYYGLYSHLERLDKEFIQRYFPEADDGDLWKSGREIKTNEESFSWDRIDALWHDADTPPELEALADVETSIYEWAAEAVIGDADGYHNGRANFYLYDHPDRGFIWLPHDMDTALDGDFLPYDSSPQFPACVGRWEPDWRHYLMMLNDPAQMERYTVALADARAMLDPGLLESKVDKWAAQIHGAANADEHRPFTMDDHQLGIESVRRYIGNRAQHIDSYLSCRANGGPDVDGDGFIWCRECDDADASRRPGAAEICNGVDDNCDGRIDNLGGGATCQ